VFATGRRIAAHDVVGGTGRAPRRRSASATDFPRLRTLPVAKTASLPASPETEMILMMMSSPRSTPTRRCAQGAGWRACAFRGNRRRLKLRAQACDQRVPPAMQGFAKSRPAASNRSRPLEMATRKTERLSTAMGRWVQGVTPTMTSQGPCGSTLRPRPRRGGSQSKAATNNRLRSRQQPRVPAHRRSGRLEAKGRGCDPEGSGRGTVTRGVDTRAHR